MSSSFKYILFDFDGTLWDHERASHRALREMAEKHGLDGESLIIRFQEENARVWAEMARGELAFEDLSIRRFQRILQSMDSPTDPLAFSEAYIENYLSKPCFLPGTEEVLATASARSRVSILTNAPHTIQDRKFAHLGASGTAVERLICSDDVGVLKPDPQFFERAAAMLDHPDPSEVLMIGDSWHDDVDVPNLLGWRTAWLSWGRAVPAEDDEIRVFPHLFSLEGFLRNH